MKLHKIAIAVVLMGLSMCAQARLSDNCRSVLNESINTFASIDALKDGYSPDNMPSQEDIEAYISAEAEAMLAIYKEGAKTLSNGATRSQAQKFIRESNSNVKSDLPADVQQMANDASEAVFMCGYDDQTQNM